MYSSLEKLDLGFRPRGDTTALLMQTDHRSAFEIVDAGPLGVLFAVARCLVAREVGARDGLAPFRVVYQVQCDPPPVLAYVVATAGAVLVQGDGPPPPVATTEEPRLPELTALVEDACVQLAREVLAGRAATAREVRALEQRLPITDEHDYYAAIVTLGAVAAAVLRMKYPTVACGTSPVARCRSPWAHRTIRARAAYRRSRLAQSSLDARRAGNADDAHDLSTLVGVVTGETTELVVEV